LNAGSGAVKAYGKETFQLINSYGKEHFQLILAPPEPGSWGLAHAGRPDGTVCRRAGEYSGSVAG
jgi:hypothetical protein